MAVAQEDKKGVLTTHDLAGKQFINFQPRSYMSTFLRHLRAKSGSDQSILAENNVSGVA